MVRNVGNMIDPLQYSISKEEHIGQIAKVLLGSYGIKFIGYEKFLPNGDMMVLCNNPLLRDFSFHNKSWYSKTFEINHKQIMSKDNYNYIWPKNPPTGDIVYERLFQYNIRNGMVMFKKNYDCFEIFMFYSDSEEATNFYVNEINILDRFILYFREQAHDIINNKYKSIWIPTPIKACISNQESEKFKLFMKQTEIKNIYTRLKGKELCFSKQEMRCIQYLTQGKSIKEIARLLALSSSTIKTYINQAKYKTNTLTTAKLKDLFLNQPCKIVTHNFL